MSETLQQRRAAFAYRKVSGWDRAIRDRATTRVKGLPVQVRTQGLGTAVATLMHQDKSETRQLADLLAEWLLRESPRKSLQADAKELDGRALLNALMAADRDAYMAAQQDAVALLDDVKTYAQALVKAEKTHG